MVVICRPTCHPKGRTCLNENGASAKKSLCYRKCNARHIVPELVPKRWTVELPLKYKVRTDRQGINNPLIMRFKNRLPLWGWANTGLSWFQWAGLLCF